MPDYLDPASIGQHLCDWDYTNWFDNWTNELYAQSTVVDTTAGPVEYAMIGDSGPVLAFMHGGPGDFYSAIAYFSDLMGKGFRCLTWSRPGFLRTPLSTGTTPETQADALAALLDTLSIDSVAVIGASAGGPPAYQFAIRHPDRTWALVQADGISRAYSPDVNPQPGVETWVFLMNQDTGMWIYNAMFEYANLGTARQFIGMMSLLDDQQNDALAESVVADPSKLSTLQKILLSMGPNSLLKVGAFTDIENYKDMPPMPFEEITAPTLIVHGTADGDVPPADAIYAASRIAGSELYWVEDGIHVATLSANAEAAMNKMLDFLNQHSPK
jgi:pimeloyl-ACP methyl ester carboxylesterase